MAAAHSCLLGRKYLQTGPFLPAAGSARDAQEAGGRSRPVRQQKMPSCRMFSAGATGLEPATSGVTGRRSGRPLGSPMVSVVLLKNWLQSVGEVLGELTGSSGSSSQAEFRPRERRDRTQEVAGSSPASSMKTGANQWFSVCVQLAPTPVRPGMEPFMELSRRELIPRRLDKVWSHGREEDQAEHPL
jgi:hypothetical protein